MIARYILFSLLLYAAKVFTWCFAWVLALFVRYAEESEITKRPSLYAGTPRAFLIRPLMVFQTHDAPLDEYKFLWYRYAIKNVIKNPDTGEILSYTPKWTYYFINLPFLGDYFARFFWLVRNPAYGLSEMLGYKQDDIKITYDSNTSNWRKNHSGYDLQKAINKFGQRGFLIQGQWLYSKTRKLEYRLGYGLERNSPLRGRGMIYARVLPWKKV